MTRLWNRCGVGRGRQQVQRKTHDFVNRIVGKVRCGAASSRFNKVCHAKRNKQARKAAMMGGSRVVVAEGEVQPCRGRERTQPRCSFLWLFPRLSL
ncbi:hypothetical protein NL676_013304 [Syzygium grande]|nr:hypothetical protein NL676_013304 [Syzygium grande]